MLFKNKSRNALQNLLLLTVLTGYALFFVILAINVNRVSICENLAFDFCAYWSAGKVANQQGISAAYDLELLTQFQKEIYPQGNSPGFEGAAMMYLPIFVLPFQVLSLIDLPHSFLIWSIVNFVALTAYLWFFIKDAQNKSKSSLLIVISILSLPIILNLYYGQVNILLVICTGEFIRAFLSNKPMQAGLWLGGWLLKPQLLILVIPFMLIQHSWKTLKGFLITSTIILGISVGLVSMDGFSNLQNVLLEALKGGVSSSPEVMMNWRMLGTHLATITSPTVGLAISIIGSLVTAFITIFSFREEIRPDSDKAVVALMGTFAATCVIAWHAHTPMSVILIPPMLYLIIKKRFKLEYFILWALFPILLQVIFNLLSASFSWGNQVMQFEEGLRGLLFNLLILGWAIFQNRNQSHEPETEVYQE